MQKANPIYQNTDISDWLLHSFRPVIQTIKSTNKAPSVSTLLCFALLCFALLNPSLIIGICQVLSCIIYNIPCQYFPGNAFLRKWQSFTKMLSSLSIHFIHILCMLSSQFLSYFTILLIHTMHPGLYAFLNQICRLIFLHSVFFRNVNSGIQASSTS